jgi:hypothetical protein
MSAFPLRLAPGPSRLLGFALAAAHCGAAAALWIAPAPGWIRIAGTLLLGASFAYHWLGDARLRLARSVTVLELTRDAEAGLRCELTLRDGRRVVGRVLGSSVALPWLVVIGLRPDASRLSRRITLLPDALAAGDFRALRVALRWGYTEEMRRELDAGRAS